MDKHLKCARYRIADYTKSARFFFRFGISKILSHRVFVIRSVLLFLFFAMIMYTENWSPKRWHINDTRRTIMADTEIALRIDISILRPFSIFRANEKKRKVFVSDPRSSIHRSIDLSFIEFEHFLDLARGNTIQFDLFWIDLNNNRIINTCRMFKRINPFVMILSESWKLFKLLLKIHIIADKIFNT